MITSWFALAECFLFRRGGGDWVAESRSAWYKNKDKKGQPKPIHITFIINQMVHLYLPCETLAFLPDFRRLAGGDEGFFEASSVGREGLYLDLAQ